MKAKDAVLVYVGRKWGLITNPEFYAAAVAACNNAKEIK